MSSIMLFIKMHCNAIITAMTAPETKVYIVKESEDGGNGAQVRLQRLFRLAGDYLDSGCVKVPQCAQMAERANENRNFVLTRSDRGKPAFENAPWLHFSISHSGGLWACAFSPHPVGLDMEDMRRKVNGGIIKRFFNPKEREYVKNDEAFFMVWTAKESYVKLLGTGIGGSFAHFSVVENGQISGEKLFAKFYDIPLPKSMDKAGDFIITLCQWEDEA